MLKELFGVGQSEMQDNELVEVCRVQPKPKWKWVIFENSSGRLVDGVYYETGREFVNSGNYIVHDVRTLQKRNSGNVIYHIWYEDKSCDSVTLDK